MTRLRDAMLLHRASRWKENSLYDYCAFCSAFQFRSLESRLSGACLLQAGNPEKREIPPS
jgi:hypothetical protein